MNFLNNARNTFSNVKSSFQNVANNANTSLNNARSSFEFARMTQEQKTSYFNALDRVSENCRSFTQNPNMFPNWTPYMKSEYRKRCQEYLTTGRGGKSRRTRKTTTRKQRKTRKQRRTRTSKK